MSRPMQKVSVLVVFLWIPLVASSQLLPTAESRCTNIASTGLQDATVAATTLVPAGGPVAGVTLSPGELRALPSFCRVQITDRPSPDSNIQTEIWLPAAGWNGRFRAEGNGGFAGYIPYELMATAVAEGYATSGTDTGHSGASATFALGHPEKVKDFGWRAVHDMTVEAKSAVKSFYGKAPEHSYFTSCSNGGRQALMEAQRFPTDYEGILAGDPAYNWTALVASATADAQALLASPASYIPSKKIPAIAAAVLSACDKQGELIDGVISDPRRCAFNPSTLVCKKGDDDTCLLPEQVETLRTIYAAKFDDQGKQVFPGYLPGAEDGPGGWIPWITGNAPGDSLFNFFGVGYFSNFVYGRPDWSIKSFNFNSDLKLANQRTAHELNATDVNIKPFIDHGGKLVLYQGWNDPAIPALSTIIYYEGIVGALSQKTADEAVRLYMVPGMQHCQGGPGAASFGQAGDGPRADASHDIFTALEEWVEASRAPGQLIGNRSFQVDHALKVDMTRPLCPYPAQAGYTKGDPKDAKNFVCGTP